MNQRILKIDPYRGRSYVTKEYSDSPTCRVIIYGNDKDGDEVDMAFDKEDAKEIVELCQALARQTQFTIDQIKEQIGLLPNLQDEEELASMVEAEEERELDPTPSDYTQE